VYFFHDKFMFVNQCIGNQRAFRSAINGWLFWVDEWLFWVDGTNRRVVVKKSTKINTLAAW